MRVSILYRANRNCSTLIILVELYLVSYKIERGLTDTSAAEPYNFSCHL